MFCRGNASEFNVHMYNFSLDDGPLLGIQADMDPHQPLASGVPLSYPQ